LLAVTELLAATELLAVTELLAATELLSITELLAVTELLAATELLAVTDLLATTERDEMRLSAPFVALCGLRDRATVNTVELIRVSERDRQTDRHTGRVLC
jgi:hypothetical protein